MPGGYLLAGGARRDREHAGRLQVARGGWVAVAPAGTCAMVLVVSEREALIRDTATLVMNDG